MGLFGLVPLVKDDPDFNASGASLFEGCILRRKRFVTKEKAESIGYSSLFSALILNYWLFNDVIIRHLFSSPRRIHYIILQFVVV